MGIAGWEGVGLVGGWVYTVEGEESVNGGDSEGEVGWKAPGDKET